MDQLTISEKGLRRVYDLLKEQADALRAAKQAALQAKLAAARREAEASGLASSLSGMGSAGGSSSSLGGVKRPSVGGGPKRPSVTNSGSSGVRRPSMAPSSNRKKRPGAFSDDEGEDDRVYGGGGGGRGGFLSHYQPQPQQYEEEDEQSDSSSSSRSSYSGGGGRASTDGNIRPKRPSAAASLPKRAKKDDFVIPKKNPAATAAAAGVYQHMGRGDDGFTIPRRESRDTYGGSGSSSDMYGSDQQHHGMPPLPPPPMGGGEGDGGGAGGGGEGESEFPYLPSKSLDRARFPAQFLVRGVKEEWDSREAEGPLVVPLTEFGLRGNNKKKVLALRVTITSDAKRFALNLCPGPLPPEDTSEPAPKEILAHFNPRRIYKNGSIVYNSRLSGKWTDDPPPTVPLKGLPPLFLGVPVTLLITLDKDLVSLSIDDHTACEIFLNTDGRGKALSRFTQLALHLPTKEETVGFQEEMVLHEVWWSPDPPAPPEAGGGGGAAVAAAGEGTAGLLAPEVARAAAAAIGMGSGAGPGREGGAAWLQQQLPPPPMQQQLPASYGPQVTTTTNTINMSGGNRGGGEEGGGSAGGTSSSNGLGRGEEEEGSSADGGTTSSNKLVMDATLLRLGGLLGQGGGRGEGMAVVAVNNLPESKGEDGVEQVKADLWALVRGVGHGPREVHLKVGASTAFVVLADAGDLAETVRRLDWTEYGGKKLRLARSNKRVF